MRNANALCFFFVISLLPSAAFAQTPDPTLEAPPTVEAAPVETPPAEPEPEEEESALHITGYIQAQLRTERGFEDDNLTYFEVRRGQLKFVYDIDHGQFMLQVSATPAGVAIRDAEATLQVRALDWLDIDLTGGLFKIPFMFDTLQSSADRWWPERTLVARRLFPGERDIGVRVVGTALDRHLRVQLALLNGMPPLGDGYRADFTPRFEPDRHKDFVARISVNVDDLEFALSGTVGTGFLPEVEDDPMTPMVDESSPENDFSRWAVGGMIRRVQEIPSLGDLDATAEILFARNLARSSLADYPTRLIASLGGDVLDRDVFAWYIGVLQHLGEYFAAGVRFDQYDAEGGPTQNRLNITALAFPTEASRLTLSYELDLDADGDHVGSRNDNQGWLRMQVRF